MIGTQEIILIALVIIGLYYTIKYMAKIMMSFIEGYKEVKK